MRSAWLAVVMLAPVAAGAYVRSTTAGTSCGPPAQPLFWNVDNISYVIDSDGSADVPLASAVAAVNASFQTWENVSCSFIAFEYGGTINAPMAGRDFTNVISWIESGWRYDTNVLAITTTHFSCDGEIVESDIEVNGRFIWTVGSQADQFDIQNVLTHEAGHFIGFAHSLDPASTMFATTSAGDLSRRTLTSDDAQGPCDVYPEVVVPTPDAAPPPPRPDARPGTPDARPGTSDARPGTPDAPPGTPDAPPGTPDARPRPDARAGTPDAPSTSSTTAAEAVCGCGVQGGGGGLLPLALFLWWMRRPRRSQSGKTRTQ